MATMRRGIESVGVAKGTAVALALALTALAPAAWAGVTVALDPATQTVAPGAEFDLVILVTQSGSAFNAFDAVIGFDPAALTPVPRSPLSLQEGALMTGACGSTFHRFTQDTDRLTINESLLCNGQSLTGPGEIYRLRFRASNTPQTTQVSFLSGLEFYNAGLYVTPVSSSDATVTIGNVGVGDPGASARGLRVRAAPNPAGGSTTLRIESDRAGRQEVLVLDALGRVVRKLESGVFAPGPRAISWNRRSDAGARLGAGLYTVEVRSPGRLARTRLVLLN
jgi:flagellar hook capping protein FlgD/cohesin domain-containing protein